MSMYGFLLLSLFAFAHGLNFNKYSMRQDYRIEVAVSSFSTRLFSTCIESCGTTAGCEAVTYTETSALCEIHDTNPMQAGASLVTSPGSTIYYTYINYVCENGWHLHGSTCYQFVPNQLDWANARATCTSGSSNIVKIQSNDEQTFIATTAQSLLGTGVTSYWIGAYYSIAHNELRWSDHSTVAFFNWHSGDPGYFAGCVKIVEQTQWNWTDNPDCLTVMSFICEKGATIAP